MIVSVLVNPPVFVTDVDELVTRPTVAVPGTLELELSVKMEYVPTEPLKTIPVES